MRMDSETVICLPSFELIERAMYSIRSACFRYHNGNSYAVFDFFRSGHENYWLRWLITTLNLCVEMFKVFSLE